MPSESPTKQQAPDGHVVLLKEVVRVEQRDPPYLNTYNRYVQCQRHGCEATGRFVVWFDGYGVWRCQEHTDGFIYATRRGQRFMRITQPELTGELKAYVERRQQQKG